MGLLKKNGATEKTRTSTGVTPQRPQRCASTNSATVALLRPIGVGLLASKIIAPEQAR